MPPATRRRHTYPANPRRDEQSTTCRGFSMPYSRFTNIQGITGKPGAYALRAATATGVKNSLQNCKRRSRSVTILYQAHLVNRSGARLICHSKHFDVLEGSGRCSRREIAGDAHAAGQMRRKRDPLGAFYRAEGIAAAAVVHRRPVARAVIHFDFAAGGPVR